MDLRCLSLGQASSLVLTSPPTRLDQALSVESIKESDIDITPVRDKNGTEPVVIKNYAKESKHLLSLYPETPPPEEEIVSFEETLFDDKRSRYGISSDNDMSVYGGVLSDEEVLFDEEENHKVLSDKKVIPENGCGNKIKTNTSNFNTVNYSQIENLKKNKVDNIHDKPIAPRKTILFFAMSIFSLEKPEIFRHDLIFVTKDIQYKIIKSHLNIGSIDQSRLASIITKGNFVSFMVKYKGIKGRWLYVLRKQYRDPLADQYNLSLTLKYK